MPENKQSEFVVTDRRKFTSEGELRSDAETSREEEISFRPAAPAPPAASAQAKPAADSTGAPVPSAEQQHAQHEAYKKSSLALDEMLASAGHPETTAKDFEVNFQRIVETYYMTAMMQMGAIGVEGEEPRVDIVGARHTVDTLGVLLEKTKGNLTPVEGSLLQNALFELRMMFLEMTNAIARSAVTDTPKAGAGRK